MKLFTCQIDAKKSKFKKNTINYNKKSCFNLIDIEEALKNNEKVPFCDKSNYFYNEYISNNDKNLLIYNNNKSKNNEASFKNYTNKIKNLNQYININDLNFENENGFKFNFNNYYLILDIIGKGSFGIVIKCWCKESKKTVAVKIINKYLYNSNVMQYIEQEKYYLLKMKHKNIVDIIKVFESSKYLVLVLELMEWCTLKQLMINRFEENIMFTELEISTIVKNILEGLNYMHMNNVMHRDIKPENVMFKKLNDLDSLKIIDLGLATDYEDRIKKYCGTYKFMAPEIIESKLYNQTVDTWSVGVILYLLCSGGEHYARIANTVENNNNNNNNNNNDNLTKDSQKNNYVKLIKKRTCYNYSFNNSFPM